MPVETLQEMWHLRHHELPNLGPAELAERFLDVDAYDAPERTVSARLSRFKQRCPELTSSKTSPAMVCAQSLKAASSTWVGPRCCVAST